MSVYLHDIPLSNAKSHFENALREANLWRVLGKEEVPVNEELLGRILAEPVWARISSPHYHSAAMDGFALKAKQTDDATLSSPITLQIGTQAEYVDTGDPLPDWANAVVPIENVEPLDKEGDLVAGQRNPHAIRIRAALPPWKHVRPMGEDMVATQLVLPAGHKLRPVDIGAIAGCGHSSVQVARKPKVAIIPTGTELRPIGAKVNVGDIIEYNSVVLASQVKEWGGSPTRFAIVEDDFVKIKDSVLEVSADHDLILLIAGSSAGSEDYSAKVVETLGRLLVHGVAVRPGHPVILGMVEEISSIKDERLGDKNYLPIIGIPGYPVSAALTGEIFLEPLLALWTGRRSFQPVIMPARLTRKTTSPPGDDDYVRVAVGKVGEKILATPLVRGAGVISSLVRADGIVIFPRGSQGLQAGSKVNVRLYRSPEEIDQTILAIGSHDMTLDILAQFLPAHNRRLASANVGSLGGLIALQREETHIAGSHLLDSESGEFNLAYIPKYLPGIPVIVVALVGRQQGLLLRKGNPKAIRSLEDLTRNDVLFVNRQRGSGTRILLDYHLSQLGVSTLKIQGYEQEEYTHLTVAAAVASGRADCGLGIAAAAKALELDFIPLFQERYDLIIPREYYNSPLIAPLLGVLQKEEFRKAVEKLPGYDVTLMGKIISKVE